MARIMPGFSKVLWLLKDKVRDLLKARWELPLRARGSSLSSRETSTLERLGEQGDGRKELDFHD
jgi:hypothetical protein